MSSKARADGTFVGAAFGSDESPPSAHRFAGLRFKITYLYVPFFKELHLWDLPEYANAYPLDVERHLCDIMNCPGKTGLETISAIDKQIEREGVIRLDLMAGVGDG